MNASIYYRLSGQNIVRDDLKIYQTDAHFIVEIYDNHGNLTGIEEIEPYEEVCDYDMMGSIIHWSITKEMFIKDIIGFSDCDFIGVKSEGDEYIRPLYSCLKC